MIKSALKDSLERDKHFSTQIKAYRNLKSVNTKALISLVGKLSEIFVNENEAQGLLNRKSCKIHKKSFRLL